MPSRNIDYNKKELLKFQKSINQNSTSKESIKVNYNFLNKNLMKINSDMKKNSLRLASTDKVKSLKTQTLENQDNNNKSNSNLLIPKDNTTKRISVKLKNNKLSDQSTTKINLDNILISINNQALNPENKKTLLSTNSSADISSKYLVYLKTTTSFDSSSTEMAKVSTPLSSNEEGTDKKQTSKLKSNQKLKSKLNKNSQSIVTASIDQSTIFSSSNTSNKLSNVASTSLENKLNINNNNKNNNNSSCSSCSESNNNNSSNSNDSNNNNNNNNSSSTTSSSSKNKDTSRSNKTEDQSNNNINIDKSSSLPITNSINTKSALKATITNNTTGTLTSKLESYENNQGDLASSFNFSNDIISHDLLTAGKLDLDSTTLINQSLSSSPSGNTSDIQLSTVTTDVSLNNSLSTKYTSILENKYNNQVSTLKDLQINNSNNEIEKSTLTSESIVNENLNKNSQLSTESIGLLNSTSTATPSTSTSLDSNNNLTKSTLNIIPDNLTMSLLGTSIITNERDSVSSPASFDKINKISDDENQINLTEIFNSESLNLNSTLSSGSLDLQYISDSTSGMLYPGSFPSIPLSSTSLLSNVASIPTSTQIPTSQVLSPTSIFQNSSTISNDLTMTDMVSLSNDTIPNQGGSFIKDHSLNSLNNSKLSSQLKSNNDEVKINNNETKFTSVNTSESSQPLKSETDPALVSTLNTYQQLLMGNKEDLRHLQLAPTATLDETSFYHDALKNANTSMNIDNDNELSVSASETTMNLENKTKDNASSNLSKQDLVNYSNLLKNNVIKPEASDPYLSLLYQNKSDVIMNTQNELIQKAKFGSSGSIGSTGSTDPNSFSKGELSSSTLESSLNNQQLLNNPSSASYLSSTPYNPETLNSVFNSLKYSSTSSSSSSNPLSSMGIDKGGRDNSNAILHPDLNSSIKFEPKNITDSTHVNQKLLDSFPNQFNSQMMNMNTLNPSSLALSNAEKISNINERIIQNQLLLGRVGEGRGVGVGNTMTAAELLRKKLILDQTNKALLYQNLKNQNLNNYLLRNKQLVYQASPSPSSSLLGIPGLQTNPLLINNHQGLRKNVKRSKINYYHPYTTLQRYNNTINALNNKAFIRRSALYQQNPNLFHKNFYMTSPLPSTATINATGTGSGVGAGIGIGTSNLNANTNVAGAATTAIVNTNANVNVNANANVVGAGAGATIADGSTTTMDILYSNKLDVMRNPLTATAATSSNSSLNSLQNINSLNNNFEKLKQNYELNGRYGRSSSCPLPLWNQQFIGLPNRNEGIATAIPPSLDLSQQMNYLSVSRENATMAAPNKINPMYNTSATVSAYNTMTGMKTTPSNMNIKLENSPSLSINYNILGHEEKLKSDRKETNPLIGLNPYYLSEANKSEGNKNTKEKINFDDSNPNQNLINKNNESFKVLKEENKLIKENIDKKSKNEQIADKISNNLINANTTINNNNNNNNNNKIAQDSLNNETINQSTLDKKLLNKKSSIIKDKIRKTKKTKGAVKKKSNEDMKKINKKKKTNKIKGKEKSEETIKNITGNNIIQSPSVTNSTITNLETTSNQSSPIPSRSNSVDSSLTVQGKDNTCLITPIHTPTLSEDTTTNNIKNMKTALKIPKMTSISTPKQQLNSNQDVENSIRTPISPPTIDNNYFIPSVSYNTSTLDIHHPTSSSTLPTGKGNLVLDPMEFASSSSSNNSKINCNNSNSEHYQKQQQNLTIHQGLKKQSLSKLTSNNQHPGLAQTSKHSSSSTSTLPNNTITTTTSAANATKTTSSSTTISNNTRKTSTTTYGSSNHSTYLTNTNANTNNLNSYSYMKKDIQNIQPKTNIIPKITLIPWIDQSTYVYQIEIGDKIVSRRFDNQFINGTKLLNVAGLTRGKRDAILKNEPVRDVVKNAPFHLKGVWIPIERARILSCKYNINERIYYLLDSHPSKYVENPNMWEINNWYMNYSKRLKKGF